MSSSHQSGLEVVGVDILVDALDVALPVLDALRQVPRVYQIEVVVLVDPRRLGVVNLESAVRRCPASISAPTLPPHAVMLTMEVGSPRSNQYRSPLRWDTL